MPIVNLKTNLSRKDNFEVSNSILDTRGAPYISYVNRLGMLGKFFITGKGVAHLISRQAQRMVGVSSFSEAKYRILNPLSLIPGRIPNTSYMMAPGAWLPYTIDVKEVSENYRKSVIKEIHEIWKSKYKDKYGHGTEWPEFPKDVEVEKWPISNIEAIYDELPTDPIPTQLIKIFDIYNGKWIILEPTFSSYTDTPNNSWEEINYVGKANKIFVYKGQIHRTVGIELELISDNLNQLKHNWQRINYLYGLMYPNYTTNNRMISPFITISYGNLLNQSYAFLESINIKTDESTIWEIGKYNHEDYSSEAFKSKYPWYGDISALPKNISLSLTFKILENNQPSILSNHFNLPKDWEITKQ